MGTTVDSGAWIRCYHPASPGAPRLVCFPHAGGSATFYFPLAKGLSPDVEVLAVQYPGRQERLHEPAIPDIGELADRVVEALAPWRDEPLHLFGHSMGATVAHEVALRLKESAGPPPAALFVSGRRAPSTHRIESAHLLDDEDLVRELRTLNGTDASLLAQEEFLSLILPALRADYRAIGTYAPGDLPALSCPVTVLVGDTDPRVTLAEAEAWEPYTTGDFDLRTYQGGHFYLTAHQAEILALLRERLRG